MTTISTPPPAARQADAAVATGAAGDAPASADPEGATEPDDADHEGGYVPV